MNAEEEGPPVQLYQIQLQDIGITITQLYRFAEFWQKLLHDGALNHETEAMILEFVQPTNKIEQFQVYCRLKLEQRSLMKEKIKKEEENYPIRPTKPIFDLSYEQTRVDHQVMVLVISDQRIEKVNIFDKEDISKQGQRKIDCGQFYGYFGIIHLKNKVLQQKIKTMSVTVEYSQKSIIPYMGNKQLLEYPVEGRIQWHLSKGVIRIVYLEKEDHLLNLRAFQKKFLLWISQKVFEQTEKSMRSEQKELWKQNWQIWKQVKPWFYLLKQLFKPCEPEDYHLLDKITKEKKIKPEGFFLKIFIWLLKNIFEDQYQSLIQNSSFVESLRFPDKYEFKLPEQQKYQELIAIEREYLRVFVVITKKDDEIKNKKIILKANIEHQSQENQSEVLLALNVQLIQKLRQLVEDRFINNRFITLKNFIQKYLYSCRSTDLDALSKNKKDMSDDDKRKESTKIIEIMKLLQRKCKALPSNVLDIEEEIEQRFFQFQIQKIITIAEVTDAKYYRCRLLDEDFASFIDISSQISKCQPRVGYEIALILVNRTFNMTSALKTDTKRMIKALMNFRQPKLDLFCKQFAQSYPQLLKKNLDLETSRELSEFLDNLNKKYRQSNQRNILVESNNRQPDDEIQPDIPPNFGSDQLEQIDNQSQPGQIEQIARQSRPELPLPMNSVGLPSPNEKPISEDNSLKISQSTSPLDKIHKKNQIQVQNPGKLVSPLDKFYPSKKKSESIDADNIVLSKRYVQDVKQEEKFNQQQKQEEKPNQQYRSILFAIFSNTNVRSLNKIKPKSSLRPQKSQLVEIERQKLSFLYFEKFDINTIERNQISIEQETVKSSDLQLDEGNCCGLLIINRLNRISSATFSSIEVAVLRYLVKISEKKMDKIRHWLKLFLINITQAIAQARIDRKLLVQSMKKYFTGERRQNVLEVELIYSIVSVVKSLFEKDVIRSKLLNIFGGIQQNIKMINFNKNYLLSLSERQSDEIDIFRLICLLFLQNEFYPKPLSIESLKQILQKGFKMTDLPLGKELIRQLIDRQLSKVMVECNQYIIKYCSQSNFVSALETFYIRCFYLKDIIGEKKSEQDKLNLFKVFLNTINCEQEKKEQIENVGIKIQISQEKVLSWLRGIFFKRDIKYINESLESIEIMIFSNQSHVQKLFRILKSVEVKQVGDILNKLLHQDLKIKLQEYLKDSQKFEKTMTLLLTLPVRKEDEQILEYFHTKIKFSPEMVPKILSICFLENQIDIGKARSVLEKMVKYHPGEAYCKPKVLMDFNSLAMQSETKDISYDFFKMVKAIWSWVQISKDSLLPYLQGSLELNNEKLRNIYLAELCDKMKLFLTKQQLQRYLFEQFISHKQGAQIIRKKLISTYYSREPKKGLEEMVKETWNCLLNKPNSLEFILYKYDTNQKQIIEKIRSKIKQKDFLIREPQIIIFNKNQNQISERVLNLFDFTQIENEANHLKMLLVNIKNVKEICQNWEKLASQAKKIQTNIENQLQRLTVKDFHLLISQYQQLSDISPLLKILMSLKEFQKKEVTNVDSLLKEFKRTKDLIIKKLDSVDDMKVGEFQELMNYFDERSLQFFLSEAKINVDGRIVRYKMTLQKDHVRSVKETLSAVIFFMKNYAQRKDLPQILQKMLQFFNEMEQNKTVKISFQQLEKMDDFLVKQLSNWKEDSSVKVLRATDQCRALFDKMEEVQLSQQTLQNLVQHFNQFQNYNNIHRELQKVFQYWERLKKCKNLKLALEMIQNLINENASNRLVEKDLEKYIKNCHENMNWLFQKLKQSSNLEFEFKKELESILKDSKLQVRRSHGGIEVIIRTKKDKIEQDEDGEREFVFKKLVFLHEKSMWVESSSRDQPQQNQSNEIQLMKQYSLLFKLIDQIRQKCFQLVSYSYDPKNLQCEIKIFDSKFDQVQNFRNYLQEIESTWVENIKDTVSRSFILTHFTGNALVNLVERIAQRGTHQGLQMLYQSCNEVIKEMEMSKLQEKLLDDELSNIDKIKKVSQILSFDNINRKGGKYQKIKLVTVEEKYFSGYVFKENGRKIPNFNQVLICREDTKIQELEFFLDRAMINSVQNHFIVGVHRVPEDVKNAFCTVMKSKKEGRLKDFEACRLVFIDNDFNNQVVFMLNQHKEFKVEKNVEEEREFYKIADEIHRSILESKTSILITSSKAGLGKTHFVEKIGRDNNKKVIHFVIPGTIDFQSLGNRLKKIEFSGSEILLLKIGFVVNKKNLDIFLTSLIVFRCFFLNEYICIHPETGIYIEIENILSNKIANSSQRGPSIEKEINILNLLRQHKLEKRIEDFGIRQLDIDEMNQREQFVLNFLDHVERGEFSKHLNSFNNQEKVEKIERKIFLLQKYFVDYMVQKRLKPTFHMYKIFMKNLYNNFSTFSNHPFLGTFAHIQQKTDPFYQNLIEKNRESEIKEWYQPMTSEQLSSYRFEFIKTCIQNSLNLVEEVYTENEGDKDGYRKRTFQQIARDSSMLIIPQFDNNNYQFVCLNDKEVPKDIKRLNLGQIPELNDQRNERINYQFDIDKYYTQYCSLNGIKDTKKLQQKMIYILMSLTRHQRQINNEILQNELQKMLKDYVITRDNFVKMCLILQREKCSSLCVIEGESGVGKTALIKFLGEQIYNIELLIFNITAGTHESDLIAMVEKIKRASEALEKKQQMKNKKLWVFFDEFNTTDELSYIKEMTIENRFMGEELPTNIFFITACNPFRFIENQIAFRVNPPPISMIQVMWDYQQLSREENRLYMEKILQKLNFKSKKTLVNVIVELHERIKREVDASAASLRDVKRFEALYLWFDEYLEKVKEKRHNLRNKNEENKDKTAILALTFCYCLRISNETKRREQMNRIEKDMSWPKDSMQKILDEEQRYFLSFLKLPDNIVVNRALKENVFTTFVCVMNKIPVLIIGCPGSSKSLSVRIIISNFFGKRSDFKIGTDYPEINMFYFQGSVSSTSEGVEEIFSRIKMMKKSEEFNFKNCIYFDEIGLAERSPHNPLKVLHSKLEINNEENDVSFIGISNYALDLSKMSRFLILNRDSPSAEQNKETAGLISDSLFRNHFKSQSMKKKIKSIGEDYSKFLMIYESVSYARNGFFGLRDFYSMVTEVCQSSIQKGHDADFLEEYYKAICRNFDGQEKSLKLFRSVIPDMNNQSFQRRHQINQIDMILTNLKNPDSRCLLLIVKRDTLIPFIAKEIQAKTKRHVTIIQGSGFKLDESREEYNAQVTYRVMKSMALGEIVVFKDINDSIQTSLYDLFNKSFIVRQNKKVCRIAVGANSNSQCYVHPNFNAIVFMGQTKMGSLDLPFLNRFQKHSLQTQSIIAEDKSIENFNRWIKKITTHQRMKRQNFLFNITEEALTTLVFKHRQKRGVQKMKIMKKQILQNRTTDFDIFLKCNGQQLKEEFADIDGLKDPFNDKDDLIIYTYHQFADSEQRHQYQFLRGSNSIRIAEINSEMSLTEKLKKYLQPKIDQKCIITLNYSQHHPLIQQILFLASKIKQQLKSGVQIVVIVQFYRFDFINNEELRPTISYLLPFSQYFVDRFDIDMKKVCFKEDNYLVLFKELKMQEQMRILFDMAISLMKIVTDDRNSEKILFKKVTNLIEKTRAKEQLSIFVCENLKNLKINYQLMHTDLKAIRECPSILQAFEVITREVTVKVIFVFVEVVVRHNYLNLFDEEMEIDGEPKKIEGEPDIHRQKQIKKKEFMEELEEIKSAVKQMGEEVFNRIKKQQESNLVNKRSNRFFFKKTPVFLQRLILSIRDKENELVRSMHPIKKNEIAESEVDEYKHFSENFRTSLSQGHFSSLHDAFLKVELHPFLLKDIITWKFNTKTSEDLDFLTHFFIEKVESNLLLKMFVLLRPSGQNQAVFEESFSILDIILKYHINLKALLESFDDKIEFEEEAPLEVNGERFINYILTRAVNLLNFTEDNLRNLHRAEKMYNYARQLIDKIFKIDENLINLPSGYMLLKNFYEFLDEIAGDSRGNLIEEFIKDDSQQSIYQKIYKFVKNRMASNIENKQKYESFLSLKFFEGWIQEYLNKKKYSQEIKNCIHLYVDWCNQSAEFANKSFSFFNRLFLGINKYTHIEDIEKYLNNFDLKAVFEGHLKSYNFFSLALNNFFIKKLIEITNGERDLLEKQQILFEQVIQTALNSGSLTGNFKAAFLKVYLSCYFNHILLDVSSKKMRQIDTLLLSENQSIRYARIFLVKLLKQQKSTEDIKRQFLNCNRCKWILKEKNLVEQTNVKPPGLLNFMRESSDFISRVETNYPGLYLFKNIKILMKTNKEEEEESLQTIFYQYFMQQERDNLEESYPLLSFLTSSMQVSQLLKDIVQMIRFVSKIHRVCNLNIRRKQKQQKIGEFIKKKVSISQREQLLKELKQYIKIRETYRENWRSEQDKNGEDLSFFQTISHLTEEDSLSKFLIIKNQGRKAERDELSTFLQQITKIYNKISNDMKTAIEKDNKNSVLIQNCQELDPILINDSAALVRLPFNSIFTAISLYSNYSVQMGKPRLAFFLSQIQTDLLNKLNPICFLKSNQDEFSCVNFLGESFNFLSEMKNDIKNKTLRDIEKDKIVEEYFKKEKNIKSQLFQYFISKFQQSLKIILMYKKNQENADGLKTLEILYQECNISQSLIEELKKEPFSQLPPSVLVDLYEYVESLSFEDLQTSLAQQYKEHLSDPKKNAQIEKDLEQIKNTKNEGLQLYDSFKRALNRFVYRKILSQSYPPSENLKDYLCFYNQFWDKGTEGLIKELKGYGLVDLELRYLGYLLKKIRVKERKPEPLRMRPQSSSNRRSDDF